MNVESQASLFKTRHFWLGFGLIFLLQVLHLFIGSPIYEIDSGTYLAGVFRWSIWQNPGATIFHSGLSKIWANVWFLVIAQMLIFAFAASRTAFLLFRESKLWLPAILIAGLEPMTALLNQSILSESLYISALLISLGSAVQYYKKPQTSTSFLLGLSLALICAIRLSGLMFLPLLAFPFFNWQVNLAEKFRQMAWGLSPALIVLMLIQIGQQQINKTNLIAGQGRARADFQLLAGESEKITEPEFQLFWGYLSEENPPTEFRVGLSFRGFKACSAFKETKAYSSTEAACACDDLLKRAMAELADKQGKSPWPLFWENNFSALVSGNYLEAGLASDRQSEFSISDYEYMDLVMEEMYGYPFPENEQNLSPLIRHQNWMNYYLPILLGLGFALLLGGLFFSLYRRNSQLFFLGLLTGIAFLPFLFLFPYKSRFVAPAILLIYWLGLFFLEKARLVRK